MKNGPKFDLKSAMMGMALAAGFGYGAAQVSSLVPYVFSAGTPIKAAEMNANFSALATGVQDAKANGLPAQTGKAGSYLKTDGTSATWSSAPGTTIQVRADKVGGTGEALPLATTTSPQLITFNNQISGPPADTGNTWDGSTFKVGANGAGLYFVQAQIHGPDAATPSQTVPYSLLIEVNGTAYGSTGNMYGVYPSLSVYTPAGTKARGMINYMIYLKANDSIKIKGIGANSSNASPNISADAGSNLLIARLN
ncbi:hypothetical protein [Deinococcus sp. PEB2-63]